MSINNRKSNLSMLDLSHGLFKIWFNIESFWLDIESSFFREVVLNLFYPWNNYPLFHSSLTLNKLWKQMYLFVNLTNKLSIMCAA